MQTLQVMIDETTGKKELEINGLEAIKGCNLFLFEIIITLPSKNKNKHQEEQLQKRHRELALFVRSPLENADKTVILVETLSGSWKLKIVTVVAVSFNVICNYSSVKENAVRIADDVRTAFSFIVELSDEKIPDQSSQELVPESPSPIKRIEPTTQKNIPPKAPSPKP